MIYNSSRSRLNNLAPHFCRRALKEAPKGDRRCHVSAARVPFREKSSKALGDSSLKEVLACRNDRDTSRGTTLPMATARGAVELNKEMNRFVNNYDASLGKRAAVGTRPQLTRHGRLLVVVTGCFQRGEEVWET